MNVCSHKYRCFSTSRIKHIAHCFLLCTILIAVEVLVGGIRLRNKDDSIDIDPFEAYGPLGTIVLYILQCLPFLTLLSSIFNFVGLTKYNSFPGKIRLKNSSPILAPFICVRIVTRGDFPELVNNNVIRNRNTCLNAGLKNFVVEVVTDKTINLPPQDFVREVVVPPTYTTKRGSLFKARALQYCLEDDVNTLSDNDWIVHLDEESILTQNSVNGILNFITDGKYQFGQGVITYASEHVVNWVTTSADSFRVGIDLGLHRFQFKTFHKPFLPWKGSFMVALVCAEREVSFDFGPEGSIGEDGFFCLAASRDGYGFDFIEGEVWEKSPFTLWDFIQQRKRWVQGLYLLITSKIIPFRYKIFTSIGFCAWMTLPLNFLNIILSIFFPVPSSQILCFVTGFVTAMSVYIYFFGAIISLNFRRLGYLKYTLCVIGATCSFLLNILVVDNIAVVWGLLSSKNHFYVVNKETKPRPGSRISPV